MVYIYQNQPRKKWPKPPKPKPEVKTVDISQFFVEIAHPPDERKGKDA